VPSQAADPELDEIERWFVERGLPHFVEREESAGEIWARALPLLVVTYLVLGLNALDLDDWSLGENLIAAAIVVLALVLAWMVANRLRGQPALARPQRIGRGELAVFVVIPALPSLVLGQGRDAVEAAVLALVVLAIVWALTSYGVGPLLRWAGRRTKSQLDTLANVAVRALPLLLLFTTFLFINTEVWQIAGTLTGLPYALVLVTFFALGALFVLSRIPPFMQRLARFEQWGEIGTLVESTPAIDLYGRLGFDPATAPDADRPSVRQRLNIGLVTVFSQAIQITLVALVITAFFVLFGFLAIPESAAAAWTGLEDVHVFWAVDVDGRVLVLSEPLLRVAGFLAVFAGMYFTVVLSTDATYREEFSEDIGPELRQTLAMRRLYRRALAQHDGGTGLGPARPEDSMRGVRGG
jgi:hypothetical protein